MPSPAQERARISARIASGELPRDPEDPLTFARPLRAARNVAAEPEYQEPVALEDIIVVLDKREQGVLTMRSAGLSLREIGMKFGLGAERIRQIQNKASRRVRDILRRRERELDNPITQ